MFNQTRCLIWLSNFRFDNQRELLYKKFSLSAKHIFVREVDLLAKLNYLSKVEQRERGCDQLLPNVKLFSCTIFWWILYIRFFLMCELFSERSHIEKVRMKSASFLFSNERIRCLIFKLSSLAEHRRLCSAAQAEILRFLWGIISWVTCWHHILMCACVSKVSWMHSIRSPVWGSKC